MEQETAADPYAEARMSVLDHLAELRVRVIRSFVAIAIGFCISWIWVEPLFDFLLVPLREAAPEADFAQMHHKDLAEPFFVLLKTAIFTGLFFGLPVIIYQIWSFIAPGLYDHEKRMAVPFIVLSTLFFVAGSAFCFYVVMPEGYRFLLDFSQGISDPQLMMSEYLTITTKLVLGFGIIFQMPVFSMFLSSIGVLTHRHLLKFWRYSIVIAFIVAAMLTPPDVITQTLMAGPMVLLYFISIGVAWYFTTKRERRDARENNELTPK